MFVINIKLRFAIIAFCLISGTILSFVYGFWYAFPLLLIGLFLLVGYFLLGTLQSAGQLLQSGDMDAAMKQLDYTIKPQWLLPQLKGNFYFMKGTILMQQKKNKEAEAMLNKAKELGMNSDDELGTLLLQLVSSNLQKKNFATAQMNLREAKKLKLESPELKDYLRQMEMALKQMKGMKGRQPTRPQKRRFIR